jgi:hypothetical protein
LTPEVCFVAAETIKGQVRQVAKTRKALAVRRALEAAGVEFIDENGGGSNVATRAGIA